MVTHLVTTATATRVRQFLVGVVIGVIPWCILVVTIAALSAIAAFSLLSWPTVAIPAACYFCQVLLAILLASAVRWRWVGIGLGVMSLLTPIMVVILVIQILPQLGQM